MSQVVESQKGALLSPKCLVWVFKMTLKTT